MLKLKEGVDEYSTDDFWYDLFDGGYIKPQDVLDNEEDIQRVCEAVVLLEEFQSLFEEAGFIN